MFSQISPHLIPSLTFNLQMVIIFPNLELKIKISVGFKFLANGRESIQIQFFCSLT